MATATEQIGPYVLEGELGRGAFGVVYLARHAQRPETPLALKEVENRGNLDRLMLEPALLSRLNHPNIVRLEDYFLDGDRLVLAMEFIDGEDLKMALDDGEAFGPAQVRDLLAQLASALAHAHAAGVVHRDLKPANVLIDRRGERPRFVLTDFGVGRVAEGIQTEKHTGGTYAFMAPEQLRGRPGPQSDLWALGVVAYRLLTGRMPFEGETLQELSSRIFYATPPPPSQVAARPVDGVLEGIVFRLLEKSLTERTASAEELLRELGHKGPVGSIPTGAAPRTAPPSQVALDRRSRRAVAVYSVLLAAMTLLFMLQTGAVSGLLKLAGCVLFFLALRRQRWGRAATAAALAGALLLLAAGSAYPFWLPDQTLAAVWGWLAASLVDLVAASQLLSWFSLWVPLILGVAFVVLLVCVPALAASCYSALRSEQRARAMRRAALEAAGDPEQYLAAMQGFLDYRFEDVGFHLKYAEALLARGRLKEAAAEARLLLRQDPYHFNGCLLLANAYFALGLYRECAAVCDDYLDVAGYCFEFSELKRQCAGGRRAKP